MISQILEQNHMNRTVQTHAAWVNKLVFALRTAMADSKVETITINGLSHTLRSRRNADTTMTYVLDETFAMSTMQEVRNALYILLS